MSPELRDLQNNTLPLSARVAIGMFSVCAAILAALQTFLQYGERSDKHKAAGSKYSVVRRQLELFVLKYADEPIEQKADAIKELEEIVAPLADIATDSPNIPNRDYDRAKAEK